MAMVEENEYFDLEFFMQSTDVGLYNVALNIFSCLNARNLSNVMKIGEKNKTFHYFLKNEEDYLWEKFESVDFELSNYCSILGILETFTKYNYGCDDEYNAAVNRGKPLISPILQDSYGVKAFFWNKIDEVNGDLFYITIIGIIQAIWDSINHLRDYHYDRAYTNHVWLKKFFYRPFFSSPFPYLLDPNDCIGIEPYLFNARNRGVLCALYKKIAVQKRNQLKLESKLLCSKM